MCMYFSASMTFVPSVVTSIVSTIPLLYRTLQLRNWATLVLLPDCGLLRYTNTYA